MLRATVLNDDVLNDDPDTGLWSGNNMLRAEPALPPCKANRDHRQVAWRCLPCAYGGALEKGCYARHYS